MLSKYAGICIDPTFNKLGKTIQINYNYHNIYVTIDFFEDKYNVVIYPAGTNVEEFEKLFVDYDYQNNFSLEELIKEIDKKIKNHPKLKDTTLIEKKKKIYSIIAWICWCFPTILCGCIAIFSKKTVKVNLIWVIVFFGVTINCWMCF